MPLYPPLYNSPSDFALNNHVAIPMPRSAPATSGAGTGHPPPCPSPNCNNHSTGPLLPPSPIEFGPLPARRRTKGGTCRVFFTVAVFCVGCLVVYFTLAHFHDTDPIPPTIGPDSSITHYRRYPRSEPLIEMDEISEKLKSKQYLFKVIVFAWKRLASLKRLMNSLLKAEYFGFHVSLEFHLDAGADEAVVNYVKKEFEWPFGSSGIVQQAQPQGLAAMVTSAWSAENDKEFAFFFEDDIEVSPFYFQFACRAISQFANVKNETVIGVALNTPRYDEINLLTSVWRPKWEIGSEARLFFFQLPSSWGVLYFPWIWREFLKFYQKRLNSSALIVPASRINIWQRSWKRYLAEMMFLKGQVLVYPSMPEEASFAVNHRERGEHTGGAAESPQLEALNTHEIDYYVTPLIKTKPTDLFRQLHSNVTLPVVSLHHEFVSSLDELNL